MKVLIPLPYDLSCLMHGRNLRIVHLVRELESLCDVTMLAADEVIAGAARQHLPGVRLVAANGSDDRAADLQRALEWPWLIKRAARFFGYHGSLLAETMQRAATVDAVLTFDLSSAIYAAAARHACADVRAVCDLIDDPWLTFREQSWRTQCGLSGLKNAWHVCVLRRRLLSTLDVLVAVAPRDADRLARTTGRPVHVIPNGVRTPDSPSETRREPLVVFTGAMSFEPNIRAACYLARRIWPQVRARRPDATLALIGTDPSPAVQELAAESNVIVTGKVDDVGHWLSRARVAAAPMVSGNGIKNKVLEACAAGTAVVATRRGAAGIPAGEASGVIVAEGARGFADQLVWLLSDPAEALRIGCAGAAMVRRQFAWPSIARSLLEVLAGRTSPVLRMPNSNNQPAHAEAPCCKEELAHAAS